MQTHTLLFGVLILNWLAARAVAQSEVILNEYNAVSGSAVLKNGAADVFFGTVLGNGGDWFELVVVGNGEAEGAVDMRGWAIEIHETSGVAFNPTVAGEVIKLADDIFFEAVQVGTILTFTESNSAQGGLDTSLNRVVEFSEQGYGWSNIFIGDPSKIDLEASSGFDYIDGVVNDVNSIGIGSNATQFRVRDAVGNVVMEISGEGVSPAGGVGSDEVFKLETNPSNLLLPSNPNYTAGTTSSFGAPNIWSGGALRQSFTSFATGDANSIPTITSEDVTGAIQGVAMEPFKILVHDAEVSDTLVISATMENGALLPDWMTLVDNGNRTADLTLGPTLATVPGSFGVLVSVTDGSLTNTQSLTVHVFPAESSVVVNEYNAVDRNAWLGALDEDNDGLPDNTVGRDTFFGTAQGNGGNWLELLVTGNGSAGSTVDMRGWSITVIEGASSPAVVTLSDEAYWATVPAGTILTFIEKDTDDGGLDTQIDRVNRMSIDGYAWTNIWIGDPIYVEQAQSSFVDGFSVSNNDTQITLRDAASGVVAGPTGEGIGLASNVNGRSVFKLRESPTTGNGYLRLASGLTGNYGSGEFSSTFGEPNTWDLNTNQQDFSHYKVANSSPVFTSAAPPHVISTTYRYEITSNDADSSGGVTISGVSLPDFLEVGEVFPSGGTAVLTQTRAPEPAERGRHRIRLRATDTMGGMTSFVFDLWAVNPAPTVILNEYNAVSPIKFLGNNSIDQASEDSFFGKQQGNGGDWFELVVVADGTAGSTIDMRGWQIEIDSEATEMFVPDNTIKFSQNAYWSAVSVGTFLTFATTYTLSSPADKLDTTLSGSRVPVQDKSLTEGYVWSHIWIGDTGYVEAPDEAAGYQVGSGNTIVGIDINHSNTQFQIRDASGVIVFGPVGEGVAPGSGVNDESIVEYEGQLVAGISPFVQAKASTDRGGSGYQEGYDTGSGGSSFGHPNAWRGGDLRQFFDGRTPMALGQPVYPIDGVSVVVPNWRVLLETPGYDAWVATFPSLTGDQVDVLADADGDGTSNELEYLMGGDPTRPDSADLYRMVLENGTPKLTYTERTPPIEGLGLRVDWSLDLESSSWQDASGIWASSSSVPQDGNLRTTKAIDFSQIGDGERFFVTFRVVR